jgi:hypothetical protein
MPENKWEYCELGLIESRRYEKGLLGGKEGWGYDCYVRYYGIDKPIFKQLSDPANILPSNPFRKAFALLGVAGWELVSLNHGSIQPATTAYGGDEGGYIRRDNIIAYFKRPIVSGQQVDEPVLVL